MKQPSFGNKHVKGADIIPLRRAHLPLVPANRLEQVTRRVWVLVHCAAQKFWRIDGVTWASAFAFNAFFSLFPLIVLFVTIASFFIDRGRAAIEIIGYIEKYIPISGKMQSTIFNTVAGVVNERGQAGAVAFILLVWVAIQCFTTLINATNRAWGTETLSWWRVPLKSLALFIVLGVAVLLGIALPVLATMAKDWLFPVYDFRSWIYGAVSFVIPILTVFLGLSLFYTIAPSRITRFADVWIGSLCATVLLRVTESLFVFYLQKFATLNALYGTFGGIMALLLWIYLSGCIFIFGVCLCAARGEILSTRSFTIPSV